MRPLGEIVRLQIQLSSLKRGERPRRWYDPAPIQSVAAIRLDSSGCSAMDENGQILDVHNALHPDTKYRGENPVSIGFTGHYTHMRDRFGDHLADGIAGESILVRHDGMVREDDLRNGVVVVTSNGSEVVLEQIEAAEPCVEFTRFALRYPIDRPADRVVTESLRRLREGVRGYYARYAGPAVTITVGDGVFLPQ